MDHKTLPAATTTAPLSLGVDLETLRQVHRDKVKAMRDRRVHGTAPSASMPAGAGAMFQALRSQLAAMSRDELQQAGQQLRDSTGNRINPMLDDLLRDVQSSRPAPAATSAANAVDGPVDAAPSPRPVPTPAPVKPQLQQKPCDDDPLRRLAERRPPPQPQPCAAAANSAATLGEGSAASTAASEVVAVAPPVKIAAPSSIMANDGEDVNQRNRKVMKKKQYKKNKARRKQERGLQQMMQQMCESMNMDPKQMATVAEQLGLVDGSQPFDPMQIVQKLVASSQGLQVG